MRTETAPVVAILNPVSGAGADAAALERRTALLRKQFAAAGIAGDIRVTTRPRHARELAAEAVSSGAGLVIAWGGDGTTNEIASALAETSTALGVIPSGSGNGLAAALGVPRSAEAAIKVALGTSARPVDAGEIEGRLFFNVAGVGADAAIAERFNAQPPRQRGMRWYLRIALHEAFRYRGTRYRVTLDGDRWPTDALIIAFANGQEYGNGLRIAPSAIVDDGKLDAVIIEDRPALERLWHARYLMRGTIDRAPRVHIRRIASAVVEADEDIVFHLDGEVYRAGKVVHVRVRPRVLTVRVPAIDARQKLGR